MTRLSHSTRIAELLVKAGLIAALAAVLLLPASVQTRAAETASQAAPEDAAFRPAPREALRLPPIPHLETMPWLVREPADKGFRIDTLLAPKFEILGPALATGTHVQHSTVLRSADGSGGSS